MHTARIAYALVAITMTMVGSGCSAPKTDEAHPSSPPTAGSSAVSPNLKPAGIDFPDMTGYTEGDHAVFFSGGQRYFGVAFRTQGGQKCVSNSYGAVEDTNLRCWGPRPDKGQGSWEVEVDAGTAATIRLLPDATTPPPAEPDPTPILPARHVLTDPEAQLVCGVQDDGGTACRIGEHGFVLTPTSTTLF